MGQLHDQIEPLAEQSPRSQYPRQKECRASCWECKVAEAPRLNDTVGQVLRVNEDADSAQLIASASRKAYRFAGRLGNTKPGGFRDDSRPD